MFIDGDPNLLSWSKKAEKFLILVRMCKRTKKILFACTFAMQMLVYICASNFAINRVINGRGRGTCLRDIYKVPQEELRKLRPGDVFLDSATGDIYCYDFHRQIFYPVSNAGIHNHKIAQENETLSKTILKSYKYMPRQIDSSNQVYIGQSNEGKMMVFKQYIQHWLTKGLEFKEHLVPSTNAWDVHPFNPISKENVYTVLAESSRGPQIILHYNAVGVQFHISPKYPATELVLRNFVVYMMNKFQNEKERVDLPLRSVDKEFVGVRPGGKRNLLEIRGNTPDLMESSIKMNQARHSGFAFSLRSGEPITVMNNATTSEEIRVKTTVSGKRMYDLGSNFQSFEAEALNTFSSKGKNTARFYHRNSVPSTGSEPIIASPKIEPDSMSSTQQTWKSKHEIRSFLHPSYTADDIPRSSRGLQSHAYAKFETNSEKPIIKISVSSKPYCRYNKEFKKYDLKSVPKRFNDPYASMGETIRTSTPYMESEKLVKLEQTSKKRGWISCKDFQRVFSPKSKTDRFKPVAGPFSLEYFRDTGKGKEREMTRTIYSSNS